MESNHILIRTIAVFTFIFIIRLIYGHRLKIGSSWFLFLLGTGFLTLSIWPGAINLLYLLTRSTSWLINVLFFLIIVLFALVVHCTVVISALTDRVKELGQQIAISFSEIDEKNLSRFIRSLQTVNARITGGLSGEGISGAPASERHEPEGETGAPNRGVAVHDGRGRTIEATHETTDLIDHTS